MKITDFTPYNLTSITVGEQAKFNHIDCPSGVDKKKRLYIKRKSANAWVYYCHHCQSAGVTYVVLDDVTYDVVSNINPTNTDSVFKSALVDKKQIEPITDYTVYSYLKQYDIHQNDIDIMGLGQHNGLFGLTALAIPRNNYALTDKFVGQLRIIKTGNKTGKTGSRYITSGGSFVNEYFETIDTCVVTEDSISAYRVSRDAKVTGLSINGTNLSAEQAAWFVSNVGNKEDTRIFVWLDNDRAGINGSVKLCRELKALLPNTKVIGIQGCKEPKRLSSYEVADIVKQHNK